MVQRAECFCMLVEAGDIRHPGAVHDADDISFAAAHDMRQMS